MDIIVFSDRDSPVHRLDPRARLLAASILTIIVSQSDSLRVLGLAVLLAFVGLIAARVPLAAVLQRVVPLNALLCLLAGVLVFTTPGQSVFHVGQVVATGEGLSRGLTIFLKSNAIVLLLASLVGSIEFVALGRALGQFRLPVKLVSILLFTVRYIDLMLLEYERLSRAALLRGFRPGPNRHTLRTTGYLIGMVLVRSYERGVRILQAMRLRGYNGNLTWIEGSAFQRRDFVFLVAMVLTGVLLLRMDYA